MTDEPTPTTPDDQPDPNANDADLTAQQQYQRAMQRLGNLVMRQAVETGTVDLLKLSKNFAMRSAEVNALTNLLVSKGVCTLEECFEACAVSAANAGNKLFAEIHTAAKPKILATDGSKLNGSN